MLCGGKCCIGEAIQQRLVSQTVDIRPDLPTTTDALREVRIVIATPDVLTPEAVDALLVEEVRVITVRFMNIPDENEVSTPLLRRFVPVIFEDKDFREETAGMAHLQGWWR
jgi:hypothetical protein